ncbi:MAG: T9SS type A sorting domain-containing protein, partial [Bacteroidota bacterium]
FHDNPIESANTRMRFLLSLFFHLAVCISCLAQNDSLQRLSWINEVLKAAGEMPDREQALANLGERQLPQGLWNEALEIRFGGELLALEAIPREGIIELNWTTATEIGSDYFAIERKLANGEFGIVNLIPAAGNSQTIRTYRLEDRFPLDGLNEYRLRQTDVGGQVHQSHPIYIQNSEAGYLVFHEEKETLDIHTKMEMVRISITDEMGKILVSKDKDQDTYARIDIGRLAPGRYAVRVENGKETKVMQFVKR